MPVPKQFSDFARDVYEDVANRGLTDPRYIIKAVVARYAASGFGPAGMPPISAPHLLDVLTKMIIEVAVTESGLRSVQSGTFSEGTQEPSYGLFQNLIGEPPNTGRGYGYTPQELLDPIVNTIIAVEALLPLAYQGYQEGGVAGAASAMVTGPGGQQPAPEHQPGQIQALINSVSGDIPPELLTNNQQTVWQETRFDPVSGKDQTFVIGPNGVAIPQYVAVWLDSGGNIENIPEGNVRTWIEDLEAGNPPETTPPDVLSRDAVQNSMVAKIDSWLIAHEVPVFSEQEKALLRTMVEEGTFPQTVLDTWGVGTGPTWQEPPPPEGADAERLAIWQKYQRGETLTEEEIAILTKDQGAPGEGVIPTAYGESPAARAAREFDDAWYRNLNELPPELVEAVSPLYQDEYYRLRNEYLDTRIPQLEAESEAYRLGLPYTPESAPEIDLPETGTMIDYAARRPDAPLQEPSTGLRRMRYEMGVEAARMPRGAKEAPRPWATPSAKLGVGLAGLESLAGKIMPRGMPFATPTQRTALGEAFAERQMARAYMEQPKRPGAARMTQAEWDVRREAVGTGKYPDIGREYGYGPAPPTAPAPPSAGPPTPAEQASRPPAPGPGYVWNSNTRSWVKVPKKGKDRDSGESADADGGESAKAGS